jgi:Winged helix-turn helix/DDE superfamily endonuclease
LKAAVQTAAAGIDLANWNWKVVRQFIQERFGRVPGRSSCWNYLQRLGFVVKRPKKPLLKANSEKRTGFVAAYVALRAAAERTGAKIFFVDEAHLRADVELRANKVLRGEPALVDTSSPKFGEKATYYSAVRLETGEVKVMPVLGNTNAETSVAFLKQLPDKQPEPLIVIWDNGPAHHGPEIRE